MAYGFPEEQARSPARVPMRQPMGGGQGMGGRPMPSRTPGRPAPAAPRRKIFNPDQEMEIRRIIQQEMRR